MGKYTVLVREVHVSHMEVEADSPQEALKAVREGGGEETCLEYSHTLDSNSTWQVLDNEQGQLWEAEEVERS